MLFSINIHHYFKEFLVSIFCDHILTGYLIKSVIFHYPISAASLTPLDMFCKKNTMFFVGYVILLVVFDVLFLEFFTDDLA